MQTKYPKKFKIYAVKRVLSRSHEVSMSSVARSLGVKVTTLHGWITAMKNKDLKNPPTSGGPIEKSPYTWGAKEKFEAIVDAAKLSEEELGEYCRKQGIFPHHLEAWKTEFIASQSKTKADNNSEVKDLKNEIKSLSTELRRKEKALAETAALLVLKKKVQDLWPNDEED
jgi:transposase